jgi:hypothetical protein
MTMDIAPEQLAAEPRERVFGIKAVRELQRTARAIAMLKPDLGVMVSIERFLPDRETVHPRPARNSLMGGILVFYTHEQPDQTLPEDSSGINYPNLPFTD